MEINQNPEAVKTIAEEVNGNVDTTVHKAGATYGDLGTDGVIRPNNENQDGNQTMDSVIQDEDVEYLDADDGTSDNLNPLDLLTNELDDLTPVLGYSVEEPVTEEKKEDDDRRKLIDAAHGHLIRRIFGNDFQVFEGFGKNGDVREYKPTSAPVDDRQGFNALRNVELLFSRLSEKISNSDADGILEIVNKLGDTITLPSDSQSNCARFFEENPSVIYDALNELDIKGLTLITNVLESSRDLEGEETPFVSKALNEEGIELTPMVPVPGTNKSIKSRYVQIPAKNEKLTGLEARAAVMSALGIRSHYSVVLPHSGLVAVFSAPVISDIIDLHTVLDNAKVKMGRDLGGINYGTTTWMIADKVVDLFVSRVVQINLRDSSPENIRRMIDPMDIMGIAWALACSMHPDGFPFSRVAMMDNGEAHVVTGTLWLPDMEVFMSNRFSQRMRNFLAGGARITRSNEEVEEYRTDWGNKPSTVEKVIHVREIKGQVSSKQETIIVLGKSNIEEYAKSGSEWDEYLRDAISKTLSSVSDERVRNNFLSKRIIATSMREYAHFIKGVKIRETINNDEVIVREINDEDLVIELIDSVSSDEGIRTRMVEAIQEYINDCTLAVYGVPTASKHEKEHSTSPVSNRIVPVNTVITFFTLIGRMFRRLGMESEQ